MKLFDLAALTLDAVLKDGRGKAAENTGGIGMASFEPYIDHPLQERPGKQLGSSFCPKCGKRVQDGSNFCPQCGRMVSATENAKEGNIRPLETVLSKCENCGGAMQLTSDGRTVTCPYCGSIELMPESDEVVLERMRSEAEQARLKAQHEAEAERQRASLEKAAIEYERMKHIDKQMNRMIAWERISELIYVVLGVLLAGGMWLLIAFKEGWI